MELYRSPGEYERNLKDNIQHFSTSLQEQRTNISTTKRDTGKFGGNHRWSNDYTEYDLGRSLLVLYDQHWTNSEEIEVSRGANKICFSTSDSIVEMDSTSRINISNSISNRSNKNDLSISSISTCDQCNVEIQATEDHQCLVWSDTGRPPKGERRFTDSSTRKQQSPPTRRARECDTADRAMEIRQLCRKQPFGSSGTLEEKLANKAPFNRNRYTDRSTTLQKLPGDLETQYSHDIPSLLNILKSIYPFDETDETSDDIFYDREIDDFLELYDISNIQPILASEDNYVFWFKDTAGAVYIWSRVSNDMLYVGSDLREALVNYLFHQDNICYVIEGTYKLLPKNDLEREAREWAESCGRIKLKVTEELLKPLKGDGKKKKKKKGKNKKNKH